MKSKLACIVVSSLSLAGCATFNDPDKRNLISTIDHSEWGDPSQLRVDLDTGAYSIKYGKWAADAPGSRGRSRGRPFSGRLNERSLYELNEMVARTRVSGLVEEECAAIPRRERGYMIVSNGGTPLLKLMLNGTKATSYAELDCWTDEANKLHDHLLDLFDEKRGLDLN
ncbi:hypothetical protein [Erythrobacter crassostreae]|uniref:Lipoprotein n=1 Tax=Erythrobacter crassostreae TaxID=2828328 RepID=A0A9X1JNX7_9SPHN|nr:hypothetical protein [Erythrobacter crassostrea]MBV7258847.1 hypothetical protein [Erythrobacter crassostrea]